MYFGLEEQLSHITCLKRKRKRSVVGIR